MNRFTSGTSLVCTGPPQRRDTVTMIAEKGFDLSTCVKLAPPPRYPDVELAVMRRAKDAPPGTWPYAFVVKLPRDDFGHFICLTEGGFARLPEEAPAMIASLMAQDTSDFKLGQRIPVNPRDTRKAKRRMAERSRRKNR